MKNEYFVDMTIKEKYISFADKLYKEVLRENEKGNVMISPYSMFVLMCMFQQAANGETREEVKDVLDGGVSAEDISSLSQELTKNSNGGVKDANALIAKVEYAPEIKNDFKSIMKQTFNAEIFSSVDMVNDVNKWVSDKTDGMIDKLLQDGSNVDIALINAISFNEQWAEEYDEYSINECQNFLNADFKTEKTTMLRSTEYGYLEDSKHIGFVKPYKGEEFDYVAIIPKSGQKLDGGKLGIKDICEMYSKAEDYETKVSMPEFSFENSISMKRFVAGIRCTKGF